MNRLIAIAGFALPLLLCTATADAYQSQGTMESRRPTKKMTLTPVPKTQTATYCEYGPSAEVVYWYGDGGGICVTNGNDTACHDQAGNKWSEESPC